MATTEQLYRRGQDGIMEKAVPEARGKAAAFDTWLAQGGGLNKRTGKFVAGPMKGKTYDQAKQHFEATWAGVGDGIKEKYAGRSRTDLAPSERIQGIQPSFQAPSGNRSSPSMSAADQQKSRMASYGYEKDANGNAVKIGTKTRTVPAPKSTAKTVTTPVAPAKTADAAPAPGSDEARRIAFEQNQAGEKYQTANVAMGSQMATEMRQRMSDPTQAVLSEKYDLQMKKNGETAAAQVKADEEAAKRKLEEARARFGLAPTTPPVAPSTTPTIPQKLTPIGSTIRDPSFRPSRDALLSPSRIAAIRSDTSQPTPQIAGVKPAPINKLTGLPFGYRPGDTVEAPQQADANASVARQISADPRLQPGYSNMVAGPSNKPMTGEIATAGAPRAMSVIQPTPAPVMAANVSPVTPASAAQSKVRAMSTEDLEKAAGRKFYTGKIKALGQASGYRNMNPV